MSRAVWNGEGGGLAMKNDSQQRGRQAGPKQSIALYEQNQQGLGEKKGGRGTGEPLRGKGRIK